MLLHSSPATRYTCSPRDAKKAKTTMHGPGLLFYSRLQRTYIEWGISIVYHTSSHLDIITIVHSGPDAKRVHRRLKQLAVLGFCKSTVPVTLSLVADHRTGRAPAINSAVSASRFDKSSCSLAPHSALAWPSCESSHREGSACYGRACWANAS